MSFESDLDAKKERLVKAMVYASKKWPVEYRDLDGAINGMSADIFESGETEKGYEAAVDEVRESLKAMVDEVFDPWKQTAKPGDWGHATSNLDVANDYLIDADAEGYENGTKGVTNSEAPIPLLMKYSNESIAGWRGQTANAFQRNYANRFEYVVGVQANLGKILRSAAKAEQTTYKTARSKLLTLMDDVAEAYYAMTDWGGDEKDFAIGVAVAAGGVIAALEAPVGAVILLAAASGGSVVNDFIKKFGGEEEEDPDVLQGDTIVELWDNMNTHLHTMRVEIQEVETTLHKALTAVRDALGGQVTMADDSSVAAMDLLMPPEPGFVEKVQKAATGKNADKELDKLKGEVEGEVDDGADSDDQVEEPMGGEGGYNPEPTDKN